MALKFSIEEGIATLILNRPEALNALDPETQQDLFDALNRVRIDPDVRVVIISGDGPKAFCVGADLKKTMPPAESHAQLTFGGGAREPRWVDAIEMDKPIICAINGLAMGGGLELALACDIRIAVETAKFALPEVRVGSIPGAGGTQRLPRAIGLSDAMLMLLAAETIDAREALRVGLISRIVGADELMGEARAIALKIAANAPLAVSAVKGLVRRGLNIPLAEAITEERMTWGLLRDTKDRIEGRVAFQEKRKPHYRGR
ncbi:enoyl-CoA hydratase/isomerase family protein [Chelatococcus asaccharovorans]|uniref:enoyl-CoA hydratase/isomerase family protein n=1 Tax=Chelatococcus asaccharovorans TaxID=28210 RepID=UPI00224C7180|nr:enoyl-CoA hydratase-related protein [Chelatococcus asaccharovorans]CAH1661387.1 3-hydroxypropionyl-coenzyme A dehydratase [Chelatococcus asaccharovorans]CAH1683489.1 3-hydroxypropionyl-coenzyme A dehydratase [Chelatococcus asaccharovorans]